MVFLLFFCKLQNIKNIAKSDLLPHFQAHLGKFYWNFIEVSKISAVDSYRIILLLRNILFMLSKKKYLFIALLNFFFKTFSTFHYLKFAWTSHSVLFPSTAGILFLIQHETRGKLLALLFKIIRLVVLSTPYVSSTVIFLLSL